MNLTRVSFFDVVSAMRDQRELRFIAASGSEVVGAPVSIEGGVTRTLRDYWRIVLSSGFTVIWREENLHPGTVIAELD